jgi:cytoskeleton protein RodZ
MSMFQRKAREDDENETFEVDPTAPHPNSVGYLLRSTREGHGWDLRDVASALRIRAEYLAALERNTVEGLPGVAYATGFLRAYADYLGLDGNDVVSRFKSEKKTLPARPELSFPVPLTDRGIPGSGLFLIAVLLIVLAYGAWYYVSSGERPSPPAVEPVPSRLLEPTPQVAPAPGQTDAAKPPTDSTAAPAALVPNLASPSPVVPTQPQAQAVAPAAPTPQAPVAAVPAPAASQPTIGAPQLAAPATGAKPQNADGTLPVVPPATPPADGTTTTVDGKEVKNYGSFANPGRIVVRAKGYAWIQVYDGKETVLTRTLHPGDAYYPPDKPSLIMRTGNAGGLTMVVDGKELPAVGPTGMVKKKIPLDPARLLSGDLGEDLPTTPRPAKPAVAAPQPAAQPTTQPGEETPE